MKECIVSLPRIDAWVAKVVKFQIEEKSGSGVSAAEAVRWNKGRGGRTRNVRADRDIGGVCAVLNERGVGSGTGVKVMHAMEVLLLMERYLCEQLVLLNNTC